MTTEIYASFVSGLLIGFIITVIVLHGTGKC